MSLISSLFGSTDYTVLTEEELALDMLKDSKFYMNSLLWAATETVNVDVRNILREQLETAINEHYQLMDLLIQKEWYKAYDKPEDQLKKQGEKVAALNKK